MVSRDSITTHDPGYPHFVLYPQPNWLDPISGGFRREVPAHSADVTTDDDFQLRRLLREQCGLITTAQARQFGLPWSQVRHRIESGHWRCVLHGVYAVNTGALTSDMTLMSALLFGGAHAILSHRTAAAQWGMLRTADGEPVHITVPYGRNAIDPPPRPGLDTLLYRPLDHPGVVVHRSRAQAHITVDAKWPLTAKADTAVDLAVAESTARAAYASLIATVTNSRIRLHDITLRLQQRPPRRYRRVLADAARLLGDGVQSVLEFHYAIDVEKTHGLPSARRQGPVIVDGRTLFEDCDYSDSGVPLIVRLDGRRTHAMAEVAFRDRRRDNAAELAGRPRLVYGFEEVFTTPCLVAGEVDRILTRGGWQRTEYGDCPRCTPS